MNVLRLTKLFIAIGAICVICIISITLPGYIELFLFAVAFFCAVAGFICGLIHLKNQLR